MSVSKQLSNFLGVAYAFFNKKQNLNLQESNEEQSENWNIINAIFLGKLEKSFTTKTNIMANNVNNWTMVAVQIMKSEIINLFHY